MRKNGVNRQLTRIDGGVCAPSGFLVNAVRCRQDFALLFSKNRCATACVFPKGAFECSARVLTSKHLQNGYARAIVISGGVMNAFDTDKKICKQMCVEVSNKLKIIEEDVVAHALGEIGRVFSINAFLENVNALTTGVSTDTAGVLGVISSNVEQAGEFAYSFELGDYACKIGGVYGCGKATLCLLTTDVNISPKMLQKAISAVVQNTFELFDYGDLSPCDGVYIMASGTAGNYQIDCDDSEYKKFVTVLQNVLQNVCYKMSSLQGTGKVLIGKVRGAHSNRAAKSFARALVCSRKLKESLRSENLSAEVVLNALYTSGEKFDLSKITVVLSSEKCEYVLFEDGKKSCVSEKVKETLLCAECLSVQVQLNEGNYSALGTTGY